MSPRKFLRLFPNASPSTFRANFGEGANPRDYTPGIPDPEPESHREKTLVGVPQGKEKSAGRPRVRITRCSVRLLDEENLWGSSKALTDCAVEAGLIPDDSPKHIELSVEQRIVRREDIRTEIAITYPDSGTLP